MDVLQHFSFSSTRLPLTSLFISSLFPHGNLADDLALAGKAVPDHRVAPSHILMIIFYFSITVGSYCIVPSSTRTFGFAISRLQP